MEASSLHCVTAEYSCDAGTCTNALDVCAVTCDTEDQCRDGYVCRNGIVDSNPLSLLRECIPAS